MVFCTAFPDRKPVRLCKDHFIKEMGHLIDSNTPVVDVTNISRIEPLVYDWDEVGGGMLEQIVEKLNEIIERLNEQ